MSVNSNLVTKMPLAKTWMEPLHVNVTSTLLAQAKGVLLGLAGRSIFVENPDLDVDRFRP